MNRTAYHFQRNDIGDGVFLVFQEDNRNVVRRIIMVEDGPNESEFLIHVAGHGVHHYSPGDTKYLDNVVGVIAPGTYRADLSNSDDALVKIEPNLVVGKSVYPAENKAPDLYGVYLEPGGGWMADFTDKDVARVFAKDAGDAVAAYGGVTISSGENGVNEMQAIFDAKPSDVEVQDAGKGSLAWEFYGDVIDSFETVNEIADEYGVKTLVDLYYLQAALSYHDGSAFITVDSDSRILEVLDRIYQDGQFPERYQQIRERVQDMECFVMPQQEAACQSDNTKGDSLC